MTLPLDLPPDDAHHATITGVDIREEGERLLLVVELKSLDEDLRSEFPLELPRAWPAHIAEGSQFDPSVLTDEWTDAQQVLYRRTIANRKNDAWLQRLVFQDFSVARMGGRDPSDVPDLIRHPRNLKDYLANLHLMLVGVECLMLRRKGQVWDVLQKGVYHDDDHKLRGYELAWRR